MVSKEIDISHTGQLRPNPALLTANDLMSYPVLKVSEAWTLDEVIRFFSKYRISRAPVINSTGNAIGVIAIQDILKGHLGLSDHLPSKHALEQSYLENLTSRDSDFSLAIQDYLESTLAKNACRHDLGTVAISASLDEILAIMMKEDRHQVFVCDEDRIVGVISSIDLMSYFTENSSTRSSMAR